ncbi:MAG: IscS subfamily cysteine desulfurase [Balneolaceae bacterium]|nr:IscS subfamily cysteine desulfurase [Balneolaceae bacterium]MBO6545447.1 IscS subfamily cysteine desulfurase [Balneolaceae bacterium]MBO6646843.1 IscS subfamily cysteine desulfurase [Balneolaceae bacterium]
MIYLDYAATTPMSDKALEVYVNVAKHYYGNASSLHDTGSSAKQIKEASAKTIAKTLHAEAKDIHFTSGASESNFLAIQALLDGCKRDGKHIITSEIEHASVRDVFRKLEQEGYDVSWLGVDKTGRIQIEELKKLITDETVLVSIQHINSEIGTIQPIKEIGEFLQSKGVLFHSDAVQSFGKIVVDVQDLTIDAFSISAHKIYGPKGVGAVWMNPETEWRSMLDDHQQNKKLKSGTDNVSGIAAFATAAKESTADLTNEFLRVTNIKSEFIRKLSAVDQKFVIEGNSGNESPFILGLRFPGIEGQFLMLECNQAGLAISTGSACQVGSDKPNRTMKALGRSDEEAREFVRFSFGKNVKEDDLDEIVVKIDTILKRHFNKVRRPKVSAQS